MKALLLSLGLACVVFEASCAGAAGDRLNARCLVPDAGVARLIGAAVLRIEDAYGPNVHVEDRGRTWLVGTWIGNLETDDEVLLGFGGRSVEVAKCSGRLSGLRTWR
jgi:hypothetical protein